MVRDNGWKDRRTDAPTNIWSDRQTDWGMDRLKDEWMERQKNWHTEVGVPPKNVKQKYSRIQFNLSNESIHKLFLLQFSSRHIAAWLNSLDAYSERVFFSKVVKNQIKDLLLLTISTKSSNLDVWLGFNYASGFL